MKNLIVTMALVVLFAMLICFQWELNRQSWQHLSSEGQYPMTDSLHMIE